ncbi:MAG: DUF5076 domain-containing protein [Pseudomonadota bacterium]
MTDKPTPIDLVPYADMLGNSREFLRAWSKPDGPATFFVNPHGLGADPFAFGIAICDCVEHAARAWARALGIGEKEALDRIWEGFDAERAAPTNDLPAPVVVRKDN